MSMLIIGHRGAAGLAPENTIDAMRAGVAAGADMLEFDVRLTKDGIPVIIHDASTRRTHSVSLTVARTDLFDLQVLTSSLPVPTLHDILDEFFGKVRLNIELKSKGSGIVAAQAVAEYITEPSDWDSIWFSSFYTAELQAVRTFSEHAKLALLLRHNPFAFTMLNKRLDLSAVGFYQLAVNPLAVAIAKKRNLTTYAYTVNRVSTARILEREGIDAIVTNRPDIFKQ